MNVWSFRCPNKELIKVWTKRGEKWKHHLISDRAEQQLWCISVGRWAFLLLNPKTEQTRSPSHQPAQGLGQACDMYSMKNRPEFMLRTGSLTPGIKWWVLGWRNPILPPNPTSSTLYQIKALPSSSWRSKRGSGVSLLVAPLHGRNTQRPEAAESGHPTPLIVLHWEPLAPNPQDTHSLIHTAVSHMTNYTWCTCRRAWNMVGAPNWWLWWYSGGSRT